MKTINARTAFAGNPTTSSLSEPTFLAEVIAFPTPAKDLTDDDMDDPIPCPFKCAGRWCIQKKKGGCS